MKAELLDHMGDDLSVVNAARVSFDKESTWNAVCRCGQAEPSLGWPCSHGGCSFEKVLKLPDEKLIRYLARHQHWTPFAHTAIKLRVSAPVPIRTQCFKHKAGFVENEESRRYISSTPELFVPEYFRSKPEGSIKQGSGEKHPESETFKAHYVDLCSEAITFYESMIENGVCPEQARFVLPQGVLVRWIWTGNLAAYARFFNQRTNPHAQKEVRDLATQIGALIEPLFPDSWKALTSDGQG
jgi:thymidylate synthase (FAD)